ncbi:YciI family protein [Denitromonas iodatirespirans]|uniref:YCII-related domain-containing protein n=1 Tax=Denitromonas iodatirespirans TaxID=2795389 RepID=A0A944DPS5_DENI1|nr:YciI family protein [Denitromonas iodatirespirans]MBT0962419.1 hypothetical protein [Denitromonas iodatirespirans]
MFVVLLRFSDNKARAAELMAAHNAWIQQGIDDGVLLLVGSLKPAAGGALLAHGVSRADLDARVGLDPFVAAGVVRAEILEIAPNRADARLGFLLD